MEKIKADENAKYWNGISQNADRQHTVLAKDKAALEQKVMTLERQVKEEQNAKTALKRRVSLIWRGELTTKAGRIPRAAGQKQSDGDLGLERGGCTWFCTCSLQSELLNLQGKMKELRFHNSALKSQIEELRHEVIMNSPVSNPLTPERASNRLGACARSPAPPLGR